IGQTGSYQVCDVREVGASEYLLTWPDTDKTAIVETSTPSGSWIDVSHAHADGRVYGGGVRYPANHNEGEGGDWLCYHRQPGGAGDIDFCIKN
ncbi:MAG: hypothetical protein F6K28_53890, partial [Microcoleus sp. SIO2G3]|nr:hypothetical protein [Microcoleus sp. SIO2G3]